MNEEDPRQPLLIEDALNRIASAVERIAHYEWQTLENQTKNLNINQQLLEIQEEIKEEVRRQRRIAEGLPIE